MWEIRDKERQRKLDELSGGNFSKQLNEVLDKDHRIPHDGIIIEFTDATGERKYHEKVGWSDTERFMVKSGVKLRLQDDGRYDPWLNQGVIPYNADGWNNYPEQQPPYSKTFEVMVIDQKYPGEPWKFKATYDFVYSCWCDAVTGDFYYDLEGYDAEIRYREIKRRARKQSENSSTMKG